MSTNLQALKTKYAEMGEEIAKLEGDKPENWPKRDDKYWYIGQARFGTHIWQNDDIDQFLQSLGNIFRTEAEANLHKLRLESMAKRWLPEDGETYWYSIEDSDAGSSFWCASVFEIAMYWIGNCHKTEQEAKEWWERYGVAFAIT